MRDCCTFSFHPFCKSFVLDIFPRRDSEVRMALSNDTVSLQELCVEDDCLKRSIRIDTCPLTVTITGYDAHLDGTKS